MPLPFSLSYFKPYGFKTTMDIAEAKQILNIKTINQDILDSAYRQILKENHPDRNGSHYLASKINEANSLLKRAVKMEELKNKESLFHSFFNQ